MMPISPEAKKRYPPEWPQVRLQILERAKWKCEHPGCGAAHHAVGHWHRQEDESLVWTPLTSRYGPWNAQGYNEATSAGAGLCWPNTDVPMTWKQARAVAADYQDQDGPQLIVIVLTVAHLNHEPEDCRPENLAAWCQRHHLAYDLEHHQRNAYATRRKGKAIRELF